MKGQTINLSIANRSYPLVVTSEEERKSLVKAAESVNERIRQYEKDYAVIDRQDLLAMTALHIAAELLTSKHQAKSNKNIDVSARIAAMEQLVSAELESSGIRIKG
ncbi:MAG: cell division protein ZapA [Bacteroidia bacterium]|nr:cell division protein ZapA [Bacteroidia bacterium]